MPSWSISSGLTLTGAYIYSNVIFPERNQHFISHIGRLKALVMFSTKLSLSAFIQYNSAEHLFLSNIRFRYNPREGNDFYILAGLHRLVGRPGASSPAADESKLYDVAAGGMR